MSRLNAHQKLICRSDGDLSSIEYANANRYKKALDTPFTPANQKQENKTKKRKDSRPKNPMSVTRLLGNTKRKRRKDTIMLKSLPREIQEVKEENSFLLRCAVRTFDTKGVIELLESGMININGTDQSGITALHEAAIDGNLACMTILVKHGARINETDIEGYTPLDYAVFAGNFECASHLIENGAREDRIRDGQIVCKQSYKANGRSYTFC